jgi:SNF2 family DNA or RNA helicase
MFTDITEFISHAQITLNQQFEETTFLPPLQPLAPLQRIGYLVKHTSLKCVESMPGFIVGRDYRMACENNYVIWDATKPNLQGGVDELEITASEFTVILTNDRGQSVRFMRRLPKAATVADKPDYHFADLVAHFDIPEVPSVEDLYPELVAMYRARIGEIEWHMNSLPQNKGSIAMQEHQTTDYALAAAGTGAILAHNMGLGKSWGCFTIPLIKHGFERNGNLLTPLSKTLIVAPGDLVEQFDTVAKLFGIKLSVLNPDAALAGDIPNGFHFTSYSSFLKPELQQMRPDLFDSVILDEATKIKSADGIMATAARRMNPKFRIAATGTPIKNRLKDLFWPLWYVAGGKQEAHPGFPYAPTTEDQKEFEADFLCESENLTKQEDALDETGEWRTFKSTTAIACNLTSLKRITAPWMLRRKLDTKVQRHEHRIVVPMGRQQNEAYKAAIAYDFSGDDQKPMQCCGKLQVLRQLTVCQDAPELAFRSNARLTPKTLKCMELVAEILGRGEQVVIFSPFHAASDSLSALLTEAGVSHRILDGRLTQAKRAKLAQEFKDGGYPVMLAGSQAMALGHSFSKCNNVIRLAFDWSLDVHKQSPMRCLRLDSEKDLNDYLLICARSIDERILELLDEKEESAAMAIDDESELLDNDQVNLLELMRAVEKDYIAQVATADEAVLESAWAVLREKIKLVLS